MGSGEDGRKELETADSQPFEYSYKIGLEKWGVHGNVGSRERSFSLSLSFRLGGSTDCMLTRIILCRGDH